MPHRRRADRAIPPTTGTGKPDEGACDRGASVRRGHADCPDGLHLRRGDLYRVACRRPTGGMEGFVLAHRHRTLAALVLAAMVVSLPPGAARAAGPYDLELPTGLRISGTIGDSHGAPVEGADVMAGVAVDDCAVGSTLSSADGSFSIRGLVGGSYFIEAQPPDGANLLSSWHTEPPGSGPHCCTTRRVLTSGESRVELSRDPAREPGPSGDRDADRDTEATRTSASVQFRPGALPGLVPHAVRRPRDAGMHRPEIPVRAVERSGQDAGTADRRRRRGGRHRGQRRRDQRGRSEARADPGRRDGRQRTVAGAGVRLCDPDLGCAA